MSLSAISIPKRYIKVQATAPSPASEGDVWYNTSTEQTYTYDGSSWNILSTDVSQIKQSIMENAVSIIILEANASLTSQSYSYLVLDTFSDAKGYKNTIDTGNTTAVFSTNFYGNIVPSGTQLDSTTLTGNSTESQAKRAGLSFTLNRVCMLVSATKHANCTADRCYLYEATDADSGTLLATQTYTANVATFNYPLNPEKTYFVLAGLNSGGAYTNTYGVNTYPKSNADISVNGFVFLDSGGLQKDIYMNILSLKTEAYSIGDTIVQTSAQTLSLSPASFRLFCKNAVAGSGAITYDISFDNGANYQTGLDLNTDYSVTNTGTQMILKINLSGTGAGNSASAYNFCLFYE